MFFSESVVIPHGYLGSPDHAPMAEFVQISSSEVQLNYYNTGDGIQYHPVVEDPAVKNMNKKDSHKISFVIPLEELTLQFFLSFMKPKITLPIEGFGWTSKSIYEDIFGLFPLEYVVKKTGNNDVFISSQISGSCVAQSFLTVIRSKFSSQDDYLAFELALKANTFERVQSMKLLNIWNERKALEVFITMAEEVERIAENVILIPAHQKIGMLYGKRINELKRKMFDHLNKNRYNPSAEFSTLRISQSDFQPMTLDISAALKKSREMSAFTEVDMNPFIVFSSFPENIKTFRNLFESRYSGRTFFNLFLNYASDWDIEKGEDINGADKYALLDDLDYIFDRVR